MYELWRAWALGLAELAPVVVDEDVEADVCCEEPLVQPVSTSATITTTPMPPMRRGRFRFTTSMVPYRGASVEECVSDSASDSSRRSRARARMRSAISTTTTRAANPAAAQVDWDKTFLY